VSSVTTHDSQAIALLCAPVAVGDAKPLTPAEWAKLGAAIHGSELGRPGALVGLSASELAEQLDVATDMGERIAALLDRGGTLAFELERLESRGVWLVARSDDDYPEPLRRRLGLRAPALLFGAGRREAVPERGVAIVGSRDADEEALAFASELGSSVAAMGATVVSGAARGIDRSAMGGALDSGGTAVGIVADSLLRLTQQPDMRVALMDERLTILTPYAPDARFSVGNAMGRNKLIYCLADAAVVVATSPGSGGTWAGAAENLKAGWVPLWIWDAPKAPRGNRELLAQGGRPLPRPSGSLLLDTDLEHQPVVAVEQPVAEMEGLDRLLVVPRSEKEVREALGLGQGRARALLKHGVESGRFVREGKPFRYVLADVTDQPTLFDAA
jgi:predicted Rossmann fold nucleotide-binding protein DprA/Smf involved in DNA uptake